MMPKALPLSVLIASAVFGGGAVAQEGVQTVAGSGEVVAVPSGQTVTLQDVIWNAPGNEGMTLRFRFVAPAIAPGGGVDADAAAEDMQHLCDSFAIPRMVEFGPEPAQVVISLSAAPVEFGATAPDVVQFFESFSVADGQCHWEMF